MKSPEDITNSIRQQSELLDGPFGSPEQSQDLEASTSEEALSSRVVEADGVLVDTEEKIAVWLGGENGELGTREGAEVRDEALTSAVEHYINTNDAESAGLYTLAAGMAYDSSGELNGNPPAIIGIDNLEGGSVYVTEAVRSIAADNPSQAEAMAEALDRISVDDSIESGERLEGGELSKVVEAAKERAESMAESGIERSEFSGEAVGEAIGSYYTDHEVTLSVLEDVVNKVDSGVPRQEAVNGILDMQSSGQLGVENSVYNSILMGAARDESDEKWLERMRLSMDLVYTEPSVGQTTLTEDMISDIVERKLAVAEALDTQMEERGMRVHGVSGRRDDIEAQIRNGQRVAKKETLPAGQLMFHNTNFAKSIENRGGVLMGRIAQRSQYGEDGISSTTASPERDSGHSHNIHFAEHYDVDAYKRPVHRESKHREANQEGIAAATIAIPVAEVVEMAPYSGGLELAIAKSKTGHEVDTVYSNLEDPALKFVGDIGSGAPYTPGSRGSTFPVSDRVFWQNKNDKLSASDYPLKISENSYVIQSEDDMVAGGRESGMGEFTQADDMRAFGGETYEEAMGNALRAYNELNDTSYTPDSLQDNREVVRDIQAFIDNEVTKSRGEVGDFGGVPTKVIIDNPEPGRRTSESIEDTVKGLQAESIDRYDGQYIVPLRAEIGEKGFLVGRGTDQAVQSSFTDTAHQLSWW